MFMFPDKLLSNGRENFSYVVENSRTGIRTLVYFSGVMKDTLNTKDFSDTLNIISNFSLSINGTTDFTHKNSRISGIVIVKSKLGPIPKEKNDAISGLEFIHENMILCRPYDNVMQSNHFEMSNKEEKELYSDSSISRSSIPSMKKSQDSFFQYINAKPKSTMEIYRREFEEQALNTSITYRYIK